MNFRPSTRRTRHAVAARAGLFAFGVAVAIGVGSGALIGRLAVRAGWKKAGALAVERARGVARELDRGLDERRRALRLLALVRSVGNEREALRRFRAIYPEFDRVGKVLMPSTPDHGRLRLIVDSPKGKVFGTLRAGWTQALLGDTFVLGLGPRADTTVLVPIGVSKAHGPLGPLNTRRLALLPDGATAKLRWSDGRVYATTVCRLAPFSGATPELAVVTATPWEVEVARARRAMAASLVFGGILGLFAGTVAWIGIARSTRRLSKINDLLERRVQERTMELAAAERSFRGIFENVPLGLYQCDPDGRFLRVNPTLARTLGYETPEDLILGLGSLHAIGESGPRGEFLAHLAAAGEVRDAKTFARTADGRTVWLAERARAVRDPSGETLFIEGAMHDVTAQHELESQLRQIGETDALTGLLNRRGLSEAILAARAPVSVVTLDVDRFKRFNDTHGHPEGDRALQMVAQAIRATVRSDDVVARAGGEEFVVILSETGEGEAASMAEAIRSAIEGCATLGMRLTVSGGVATSETSEGIAAAFSAADRALYRAKKSGRNRVVANSAKLA